MWCTRPGFSIVIGLFFSAGPLAVAAIVSNCLSFESLGLSSGFRVIVAHSPVAPHRIEFTFRLLESLFITDWQFASSCFPRTDFAAAVTFSYRPVDPDLTGTRTPPRQRFRSRTTKPLRGECFASSHRICYIGSYGRSTDPGTNCQTASVSLLSIIAGRCCCPALDVLTETW
jgi:hypothetical protein